MRLTRFIGGATVTITGCVVAGLLLPAPALASLGLGTPMKLNGALCFAMTGAGLLFVRVDDRLPTAVRIAGLAVAAVGAATLLEIALGANLGLDEWIRVETFAPGDGGIDEPGRMAATTATALLCLGTALCTIDRLPRLGQALAIATGVIGLLGTIDVLYALLQPSSGADPYRRMSVLSALFAIALPVGLLASRPRHGAVAVLTAGRGEARTLARRLLPLVVAIPLVLGALRLVGENVALYESRFGTSLLVTSVILLLAGAVVWNIDLVGRAEERRQRHEEETRRSNDFLDAVIENIPDMIFVKDAAELRFQRFNRAGEQLTGIPRGELLGKNDHDFFPPEEAVFFQAKDRETLAGGTLVDIPEEKIDTRDGVRWLHTKKVPLLDENGRPAYLLGISQDITAARSAQREMRKASEDAEAAHRELEAFSYSVSHDLRAPLRSIDGFSLAILEDAGDKLDEDSKQHLQRVRAAAQRMAELIDDLLELARVSRAEMHREPVDLARLAREIVDELRQSAPARALTLVVPGEVVADGDARLLRVALQNLLDNAWKFTSKHPAATIELGASPQNGAAGARRFFVRDDGVGFDPTYAGRLFGAFQRLHSTHDFAGTGIGLATVQRIVRRHGGRIWAESQPGRGATFYFTLSPGDA